MCNREETLQTPQTPCTSGICFSERSERIDWRKISAIDFEKLKYVLDIDVLQDNVGHIAFCNIEFEMDNTTDVKFVKLFKLSQLIIRYLLYSQGHLIDKVNYIEKRANNKIKELQTKLKELKKKKKPLAIQCSHCQKIFINDKFLKKHLLKKHKVGDFDDKSNQQNKKKSLVNLSSGNFQESSLSESSSEDSSSEDWISISELDNQENLIHLDLSDNRKNDTDRLEGISERRSSFDKDRYNISKNIDMKKNYSKDSRDFDIGGDNDDCNDSKNIRSNDDSKDPRVERRIRKKVCSIKIYRPGMRRLNKQRNITQKEVSTSASDSSTPTSSPTPGGIQEVNKKKINEKN